jgi:hypothetical protein
VMKACEWQGTLEDILEHVQQKHSGRRSISSSWSCRWRKGTDLVRVATGILTGLTDNEQVIFYLEWSPELPGSVGKLPGSLRAVFWHVSRSPEQWRIKFTMPGPHGLETSWCSPINDLRTPYKKAIKRATTFKLCSKQAALFDYGLDEETLALSPVKPQDPFDGGPVLCFAAHIYRNN